MPPFTQSVLNKGCESQRCCCCKPQVGVDVALTCGSGQQPHVWVEDMKQQVAEEGQLVWVSHRRIPFSS